MFQCQECGRIFKTARAAEKASWDGCPECGGSDIDILPAPTVKRCPVTL
jgi:predicted  nucleic acid-binding Zn-ribbon protein